MTPLRLLSVSVFALAITACSNTESTEHSYDTSGNAGQGGVAQGATPPVTQAANPIYDTPAAYEESAGPKPSAEAIVDPGLSTPRSTASKPANGIKPSAAKPAGERTPSAPVSGGTTHTVVKGDTLGGIAKKYGVSQAALKKANNMSNDTVVLGKQLQIPAH